MSRNSRRSSRNMSLSPWDLSGLGLGFGLYRPRRPSYTFATQYGRQRSESYRYAVKKENSEADVEEQSDFIEGMLQKKRKLSYVRATHGACDVFELSQVQEPCLNKEIQNPMSNNIGNSSRKENHMQELKLAVARRKSQILECSGNSFQNPRSTEHEAVTTPDSDVSSTIAPFNVPAFKKNLILLCSSFILIFSSFRAIQNLQSSLNSHNNLGIITMGVIHGTMVFTGMLGPSLINAITAKWALVCGMFCYLSWIGANFYPRFYTLIPTAVLAGFGQGILWTAESSYIIKLAFDSSRITKDGLEHEVFRFHGIFLACFQTTHIWGNLVSSVMLSNALKLPEVTPLLMSPNGTSLFQEVLPPAPPPMVVTCGVLYPCLPALFEAPQVDYSDLLIWKLMSAYLILGFVGFCLILLCLDRIGAQVDPEKSCYEIIVQHVVLMITHKTFRLLIPLLIFSGLQQGFMYADFNKAYVDCALGTEYIGYAMIVMGVANVVSAIMVAVFAKRIPREVVFGIGGITHMGLMIGFLVWMPEKKLLIFFLLSASWGMCDAVWQTQCNTLICLTCTEEPHVAFANYRLMQSFGLMLAFVSGTFMCVSGKLYTLMIMLVVSIMFYVLAEYRVRQVDNEDDEGYDT